MAELTSSSTLNGVPQPFVEAGSTGLKHHSGRLFEDYLHAWKTHRKQRTIQEMQTDPIVTASLWVYEMLIRQVTWDFTPAGEDTASQEAAEFARQVWFEDMNQSWSDTLAEILTFLPWGWSFFELVYKRRLGDHRDPSRRSRFTDGRIGIRKMPIRGQATLDRWDFDDEGGIQAMRQRAHTTGASAIIPIEKALLFRTTLHLGSPEGRSVLRGCYIPWYQRKHLSQIQAIGIERDAAGLPVVRIPGKFILEAGATYDSYTSLARNLRNDEQAGIVIPSDRDEHGNLYYELELLSAAGSKQYDIDKALQTKSLEIMLALMTDVLMIGHEQAGSFALSSSKTTLLSTTLGGIMDIQVGVINRHGMPRLWQLNGLPPETMPTMIHGDIETQNLDEVGNFILRLSQAGFQVEDLENEVRRRTGFPLLQEVE